MGMSWVWVDRKFDLEKIIVELNLTLKPAPMGEISHLNPSDFVNGHFLLGFFQVSSLLSFFRFYKSLTSPQTLTSVFLGFE
jgi:hypothetical protein